MSRPPSPRSFPGQGTVVGVALRRAAFHAPVVGGEDDVGVLAQLVSRPARVIGLVEVVEDHADVVVEFLNHRAVKRIDLSGRFLGRDPGRIDAEPFAYFSRCAFDRVWIGAVHQPGA